MKTRDHRHMLVWICVVSAGLLAPAVGLAGEKFSLVSAVPDDVFMCVAGQHNPERKFLDDYWGEVFEVLKQSGLSTDLMNLIGSIGSQEQQAEAEKLKQLGTDLFNAVEWGKLWAQEGAFAIRMPRLKVQGDDDFQVGGVDEVILFRGEAGSGAKNFAGLVQIAETLLGKVNETAGTTLTLEKSEQAGTNVATVTFIKTQAAQGEAGGDYGVAVAQRGDIVAILLGGKIRGEVLDLLAGGKAAKPLSASPRFKQAFAKLPAAEDEVFFFDMQRLLTDVRAITDPIFAAEAEEAAKAAKAAPAPAAPSAPVAPQDRYLNAGKNAQASALVEQSFKAYQGKDYKQALSLVEQAYKIDPTDSIVMYNLACFNALVGNSEQAISWLEKAVDGGFQAPNKIAEDSDLDTIRSHPRYQAILAKATELAPKLGSEKEAGGKSEQEWAAVAKVILDRLMSTAGMMDYAASVGYTEGYAAREESVVVLTPEAPKQAFYPVFGKRKPLTDFAKYLPAETVSFSVCGAIDLVELYNFLEETIRLVGAEGQMVLQQWAGIQQQIGLDVRKDILSWLHGDTVSATVRLSSGDASVWMVKVTDEAAAREKVETGLKMFSELTAKLVTQNPMLGMVVIRTAPCTHEKLAGFQNIMMQVSPQPMVCGVANGHIILATSEQAAALCLATAAGEHPNVTKNAQVMSEALVPTGPFDSIAFTDMRQLGTEIAQALGIVNMVGGMASVFIPNPEAQKILSQVFMMLGKLVPAAQKIDFYKSSASYTTFDGKVWYTKKQTSYVSPTERGAPAKPATAGKAV